MELYREIIETVCMYFHIYERSQSEINETKRDKIHIFELSMSTLIIAQLLFFVLHIEIVRKCIGMCGCRDWLAEIHLIWNFVLNRKKRP